MEGVSYLVCNWQAFGEFVLGLSSKNRWSLSSGRPWSGEKMVICDSCLFCKKEPPAAEMKQRQTSLCQFGVVHGDLRAPFFS